MENLEALNPVGIAEFLSGSAGIDFTGQSRSERYAWLQSTLVEQRYFSLGKKQRGMVRALIAKVAGLSMAQVTRLIRAYRKGGRDSGSCRNEATIPGEIHNRGLGIAD